MHKNTIYITFDGLSDPLGQSQILPYLCGIATHGFRIHILSCEKKNRLDKEKQNISQTIGQLPITWEYILYDSEGGALSRLHYVQRIHALAKKRCREKKIQLVHCRSYLASLIGLSIKRKYNIPFIFDMRGFWADERMDGGIWKKNNPLQNFFFNYFKKKEKQFILNSNAIVSLTHSAVTELSKKYSIDFIENKTSVIPCCTNTALFKKEGILPAQLSSISPGDHLIIYTGSVGTWYYTKEMIECILCWKEFIPSIKLLILTNDTSELKAILANFSEEQQKLVVTASASYRQVPAYLALAKAAIFFIKPSFSKIASSPTKMAECWAMDLPIITNAGIGDNDLYFNTNGGNGGGVLLKEFTVAEYISACHTYLALPNKIGTYREIALHYFDTQMAIDKYSSIYKSLTV